MSERMSDEEFDRLTDTLHYLDDPIVAEARRAREAEDRPPADLASIPIFTSTALPADGFWCHPDVLAGKLVPHESRTIPAPRAGMGRNEPVESASNQVEKPETTPATNYRQGT